MHFVFKAQSGISAVKFNKSRKQSFTGHYLLKNIILFLILTNTSPVLCRINLPKCGTTNKIKRFRIFIYGCPSLLLSIK